jgi:hypothetical protein
MRQVQWTTLVKAADKDRNKPEPSYVFTGSNKQGERVFYQPVNWNPYTGSSA